MMKYYDGPIDILLRVLIAAGLVVDAVIHLQLAGRYSGNGSSITQADVFRIEAVVALLVAALVLFAPWKRIAYLIAFLVAASAFGAVMLYRYVNVGSIGPLPNMYEPIWYTKKTVTAYAEAGASIVALVGFARSALGARRS
jgi:hypothetical protein